MGIGAILRNAAATFLLTAAGWFAAFMVPGQSVQAQVGDAQQESSGVATLQGVVRDSSNRPVAGVTVCLRSKESETLTARTDSAGAYRFMALHAGVYTLRAERAGFREASFSSFVLAPKESRTIDLALEPAKLSEQQNSPAGLPEFFDEPHFTVAGVTDTTSAGGHASDTVARNREALAQATASLSKPASSPPVSSRAETERSLREAFERQPEGFDSNHQLGKLLVEEGKSAEGLPYLKRAFQLKPGDNDNDYELALAYANTGDYEHARVELQSQLTAQEKSGAEKAETHHLLGEVDEKLGDPLHAVREYQRAAELEPSEAYLFDWGAELLMHRAPEPALEVFTKGNRLFPRSVRMLTGLGASWYAVGSYDRAAQRLCEASDLNPDDPTPYLLMGKMQAVESTQSEAIVERLRRFVNLQPENALANYYYAVSLWKLRKSPEDTADDAQVKSLLEKAVHLDPKLGLAYLQLGVLYSEREDLSNAVSAYQKAIESTPRLEEAHYRLARAYRQSGKLAEAQAELQLYSQISKEKADETERHRRELQRFVYEMRDAIPFSPPL